MEFMQVLSFILMFLSFALIGWMIFTFRKVRTVSTRSPLIAMGMSLVFILVYWLIIGTYEKNLPHIFRQLLYI